MADRCRRAAAVLLPALLALALLSLAGCTSGRGSAAASSSTPAAVPAGQPNHVEDLPAAQIVAASRAAAKSASSVHVTGTQNGTTLDLRVGRGTATGTVSQAGITAELLAVDGATYIKGDKAFWDESAGPGDGDVLAGKWVVAGSTAGDQSGITGFTDIDRLFDLVVVSSGSTSTLTRTAPTTIDGQHVVGVTEPTDGSTLYVALTGPPYPVTIRTPGASGPPPTFAEWDAPIAVHTPTPDEIVDPSTLGG